MRPFQFASIAAISVLFFGLSPLVVAAQREAPHVRSERRDLRQIASIAAAWGEAARSGNRRAERRADRRLERWLQAELAEASAELTEEQRAMAAQTASGETVEFVVPTTEGEPSDELTQARQARTDVRYLRAIAVELRRLAQSAERGAMSADERARKRQLLRILVARARLELREDRTRSTQAGR